MICSKELNHKESRHRFAKPLQPTKHTHGWARGTELESHEDIDIVFETTFEVNNIGMFKRVVNLDFGVKVKEPISEPLIEWMAQGSNKWPRFREETWLNDRDKD